MSKRREKPTYLATDCDNPVVFFKIARYLSFPDLSISIPTPKKAPIA